MLQIYKTIQKKQALLHEFLIGQPFGSVGEIDDAAILEAGLGYNVLHDMVVAVRVDSDIAALGERIIHYFHEYAMGIPGACDPVDDHVWQIIVEPLAYYPGVSRFRGRDDREICDCPAGMLNHPAYSALDVGTDLLFTGIRALPLMYIPVRTHYLPGLGEKPENRIQVAVCSRSYHHVYSLASIRLG